VRRRTPEEASLIAFDRKQQSIPPAMAGPAWKIRFSISLLKDKIPRHYVANPVGD